MRYTQFRNRKRYLPDVAIAPMKFYIDELERIFKQIEAKLLERKRREEREEE